MRRLVALRQQGRHKYFALADGDVAHALEALAFVAERDTVSTRWERPAYKPLKYARRCYGHMAGELGVAQFEMLMRCGYLLLGAWENRIGRINQRIDVDALEVVANTCQSGVGAEVVGQFYLIVRSIMFVSNLLGEH